VKLAVPKECRPGERRVAVTPENVARLIKLGFAVAVEHDAGAAASFSDDDYVAAGAEIVAERGGGAGVVFDGDREAHLDQPRDVFRGDCHPAFTGSALFRDGELHSPVIIPTGTAAA